MSNKAKVDYWEECIAVAADECDIQLTKEQVSQLAYSVRIANENYDMAFYSPPSSDRISSIERDWKTKYEALQRQLDEYRVNAETAVIRALRLPSWAQVSIKHHGEVERIDP